MIKASVIILTKNRAELLRKALASVRSQRFSDYEIIVIDDGSTDHTAVVLNNFIQMFGNTKVVRHDRSVGITTSRQEALEKAQGEYVAFLDDDDEWIDEDKLSKQVAFLDRSPEFVMVGGGMVLESRSKKREVRMRPETDELIREQMLLRNCFFNSTVMLRRQAALDAGGFQVDEIDLAEDYDLWLRLGLRGKMYNFQEPFTRYALPSYPKEKKQQFFRKQLRLVERYRGNYRFAWLAKFVLKLRLLLGK